MKIKIQKYNPATDDAPYFVTGDVEWRENITALDAVYAFHANVGPVSFDYSCGGRVCGRCAAMVDGEPKPLCMAVLDDSTHTIEPLAGFPIIRDLTVDKKAFDVAVAAAANRVMIEPVTMYTAGAEGFDYKQYTERDSEMMLFAERCSRCGICMSACSARALNKEAYVGPAIMLQEAYRYLDWYDKADRVAGAVGDGLFRCILCGKCDEVCPQGIPHMAMWKMLREAAEARGLKPAYADEVLAAAGTTA